MAPERPAATEPLEEISCNLCGSRRTRLLHERPSSPHLVPEEGVFSATTDEFQNYGRIVRCLDCGLAYTNPRPRAADIAAGYAACVDEMYLSESTSRSINSHLSLNTVKRFVRSGRLLEVGVSTGYFLNAARVDYEVTGLEPSDWACRIARERFGLAVYPETLESSRRFAPGSFDVVAMIDVIEHLSDPRAAVRRAVELLRPGGLLYLVTPDIGSLSARLLRGYWWGLRPAHLYYFDQSTIGRLLDSEGLEMVLSKSFGRIFSYGYWVSRLKHYPPWIYGSLRWMIRHLDIGDKLLYLDTRDSIEICACKRGRL